MKSAQWATEHRGYSIDGIFNRREYAASPADSPNNVNATAALAPASMRNAACSLTTWRTVLLFASLALAGCSDLSRSSFDTLRLVLHRHGARPTAAEVAAKSYYQLQATGPDGTAVLILGNIDGKREAWYGSHSVVIFIENGRIVQTTGLRQNLDGLRIPAGDPLASGLQNLAAPMSYAIQEDWSPGYRYGVTMMARLAPAGLEQVEILGVAHSLLRVDEQLDTPSTHEKVTNRYWVDPADGFIWKSRQQVAPGLSLDLLQLRPYRGKG